MKKLLVVLGVVMLFNIDGVAQVIYHDTRRDVAFGVKAGVNVANVWDESGTDFRASRKLGFVGGGFLSIPISKLIGLQPELILSQKGFKGSGSLLGSTYTFSRTTTYIDIPLLVQFKPLEVLTLVAGPQYSYLVRQHDKYTSAAVSVEQEQAFKSVEIRKNTFGLLAGADIILSKFVVSGRAGWGVQSNASDGRYSTPRYKNRWLQLTVGLQL